MERRAGVRRHVSAGRPWGRIVGYSRAVRVGETIEVSGTAPAAPDGTILAPGDLYGQTRESLRIIGEALRDAGADFEDVVRTRIFVIDIARWRRPGARTARSSPGYVPPTRSWG